MKQTGKLWFRELRIIKYNSSIFFILFNIYGKLFIFYCIFHIGDIIRTIFDDSVCDTNLDQKYPIDLDFGSLYTNGNLFYIYGKHPIGEQCRGEVESGRLMWTSLLSVSDVISLLLSLVEQPARSCGTNFPQTEFDLKVHEGDSVFESSTDHRGYPKSCGVKNANKKIIVVVKGK